MASWHPGFSPKSALPIDRKAGVIGTGSVIGLPVMPSWLCNVRRKATEDWLTALKCQPVGTDGTIKGSPSPRHASQHQNFIWTGPLAGLLIIGVGFWLHQFCVDLSPPMLVRWPRLKSPRSRDDDQAVSYSLTFLQSAGAFALRPCCAAPEEAAPFCRLLAKVCPALRTRYRVRRWHLEGGPCPRLGRGRLRHCWLRRWCWHCWKVDCWKVRVPRRWRLEGRLRGAPSALGL